MFLDTFENMCNRYCKKGKWTTSEHTTPYDEKCKICGGSELPPELIILNRDEENKKMENDLYDEIKNRLETPAILKNPPLPPEPPPKRIIKEDVAISTNKAKTVKCSMCEKDASSIRSSFGKKICQTCYVGSRFIYKNPKLALNLLEEHHPEIFILPVNNIFEANKNKSVDENNHKEENKKLKKIIDFICEKLNINIYDSLFEKISEKLKN